MTGDRTDPSGASDASDAVGRTANVIATVVPAALVGVAAWLAWGGALHWPDLVVLAVTYLLTGVGITVGFHRLFTHRSFKTSAPIRALLAVLGSAAVEGPVIEWVANHRKHHRFSDQPGDPHSPHVEPATAGAAHLLGCSMRTWDGCSKATTMADQERYAKDLLADPVVRFIDRTFPLWVIAGLAFPVRAWASR